MSGRGNVVVARLGLFADRPLTHAWGGASRRRRWGALAPARERLPGIDLLHERGNVVIVSVGAQE